MLELFKRNRLALAGAGVLIVLILLLSIRWRDPGKARVIDETLNAIAYPFQVGFSKTVGAIERVLERYVFLVNLKKENEQLKNRTRALEEELNLYINSSIQFTLLREQLGFKEDDPKRRIYAEVIGESADNLHHTLLINKGRLAGIRRNYPVVLREGVVGRIQSATAFQSVVQLIVDRRHRFPVILQRSRERVILEGSGAGQLRMMAPDRGIVLGQGSQLWMERIRMLADVKQGDRVITSGLAGIFPKGLLVGVIMGVSRERHELFQTAEIQPVVDFNRIEGVYVITKSPDDPEQPFFSSP